MNLQQYRILALYYAKQNGWEKTNMGANNTAELNADGAVLLRTDQGGIANLTLNRPNAYNALSEELLAALQNELDDISNDS